MRIILAVIRKQLKDTLKNKEVLIQFVMFPALAAIMNSAVQIPGMEENFFVKLFATMYIGMAPITSMSSILSEEKEKNTLRVLLMGDVKPWQYLLGIGGYIWGICMLGAAALCVTGKYEGMQALYFMGIMAAGIFISVLFGAAIGAGSKNQMSATAVTVPVMLVFSFLPMLSMFNETIKQVAKFTYSQQIHLLMNTLGSFRLTGESIMIFIFNILAAFFIFQYAYKRKGLE